MLISDTCAFKYVMFEIIAHYYTVLLQKKSDTTLVGNGKNDNCLWLESLMSKLESLF